MHGPAVIVTSDLWSDEVTGSDSRQLERPQSTAEMHAAKAHGPERGMSGTASRYQAMFDSAVDFAIVALDLSGRVTDWNVGAERIFGWSAAQMTGEPLDRLFTPQDRSNGRLEEELRTAALHGRASDERWHLRADGATFWASGSLTRLTAEDGAHIGYLKVMHDRSEQHAVHTRLEDEEARYHVLVESIEAGFCILEVLFDPGGRACDFQIIEVNPAFERQTGIRDAVGHWISDIAPGHEQYWFDAFGEVIRTGRAAQFENYSAAFGRWYDVYAVRIGNPAARRVAVLFNDMSERREAELALERSEAHWRGLFETLQEGFILGELVRDEGGSVVDWRYVDVNAAWCEVLGRPVEAVRGRTGREVTPGIEPEWLNEMATVVQAGTPGHFTRQMGQVGRWFDGRIHRLDANRFAVTVQEVTQRRRDDIRRRALLKLADVLRDSQDIDRISFAAAEVLGETLAASRAGYCTISASGHRVRIRRDWHLRDMSTLEGSMSLRAMGGFAEVLLRGESVAVHDVRTDPRTAQYAEELDALSIRALLQVPIMELGRAVALFFVCSARATAWQDDDIGFVLDVASRVRSAIERRRAEHALQALNASLEREVRQRSEELLRSEEKLRQSQKMEAVGQLTGGIAHDFNNLLTGINGSLELLQSRIAKGQLDDVERFISAAQGASKRAASLTHRLLAFSRQQTLDPKPTDVNALVNDLKDLVGRTAGPSVELVTTLEASVWLTLVDLNQLENAVLNLCINARDAMPAGGRLTLLTRNDWMNSRVAAEAELPPGHYVTLEVTDTGVGMPPEIAAKAFDPFFTTKPLGMGTGLGLSMVYGFVRQSGGQVRIRSAMGKGTTVALHLPRYAGEELCAEADEPRQVPRSQSGETVLVVDDEPTVRMLIVDVLNDLGYATLEAADGAAGLALLRSGVQVDLLVSDIGLPGGLNGRDMAEQARLDRPDLRVLFITGYAEASIVGDGKLPTGMHVMTKPFGVDAFAARIKSLLADG